MDELQIEILESIGGWGFNFQTLYNRAKDFRGSKIRVPVNSWGGDAFQGLLIHNYLKGHKAHVEVHIPAYAASAGTMIAAAADHVTIADNGYYMIHNPAGATYGESTDMERSADLLKKLTADMVDMYHEKTKLPKDEIAAMMEKETWMTAKEALKLGFVDALTKGAKIQASADITAFQNAPKELTISGDGEANSNQQSKPKMEEKNLSFVAGFIGLQSGATLADVQSAIFDLRQKAGEVAALKAQIKAFEEKEKSLESEQTKSLLDAALSEGRITNEQRPHMEAAFKADFNAGKGLLATMTKRVSLSDVPNREGDNADAAPKYQGKTLKELDRENPEAIKTLKATDLPTFKAMFKAEYGEEYIEKK